MTLSIEQLFKKAEEQLEATDDEGEIAYVFDNPIHYIILNREDNTVHLPFIRRYIKVLDQIEATQGPGVVITIGSG